MEKPAENTTPEKKAALNEINAFMKNQGISVEELTTFQTGLSEVTEEPALRPSEIAGVSNEPVKTNEQLTSELAELTRRFNNLNAAHHNGEF